MRPRYLALLLPLIPLTSIDNEESPSNCSKQSLYHIVGVRTNQITRRVKQEMTTLRRKDVYRRLAATSRNSVRCEVEKTPCYLSKWCNTIDSEQQSLINNFYTNRERAQRSVPVNECGFQSFMIIVDCIQLIKHSLE